MSIYCTCTSIYLYTIKISYKPRTEDIRCIVQVILSIANVLMQNTSHTHTHTHTHTTHKNIHKYTHTHAYICTYTLTRAYSHINTANTDT